MSNNTISLESLPPRPPTPPKREAHNAPPPATIPRNVLAPIEFDSNLKAVHTPPALDSPASGLDSKSTSRQSVKRVGFSAKAEYKEAPVFIDGGTRQQPTPVSLSRSASKPVKSILKITHHVPNPLEQTNGDPSDPSNTNTSVANMLESTLKQLAGGDRDSKLDSYMMLTRAFKVSNNLPDRVALHEKMGLFMQFMQRDLVARTPQGTLDSSLVQHALKLIVTFLGLPAIASTITTDFGAFLIDHCIRSFQDSSTPKDTARHLMQVVLIQNFSSKVMTPERVGRLVTSLHNIEENVKGKSIIMYRVMIYQKLVNQTGKTMVIHSDWLYDLFTDMLSTIKDIREKAVTLGLNAAFTIGHEVQLSRKAMEIFNSVSEDKKYIQYYEERLKAMVKDKAVSASVPHIWSVVILLLRIRLRVWDRTAHWLTLVQNCFNNIDYPTKIAAHHAWARLTYLTNAVEPSFESSLKTIITPLTSQLKRKNGGKASEGQLRAAVLGDVCNLWYYLFKPNTNVALLDGYWKAGVQPIITALVSSPEPSKPAAENPTQKRHEIHGQASLILSGLFNCTTARRWSVDRVMDEPLASPQEVPAIDARWVRKNAPMILAAIEPMLAQDFVALSNKKSAVYWLWASLVGSIASAASKEIKVSKDTGLFITEALSVLQKIWLKGVQPGDAASAVDFLRATKGYVEIMISSLGLLPFTEKLGKAPAVQKSPMHNLFSTLSGLPSGIPDDETFEVFFTSVFEHFTEAKSDKGKMETALELLTMIPMETPRPYGMWLFVAKALEGWLQPDQGSNHATGSGDTPIGHDYRDIVKVLERGLRSTPNLPREHWESLFNAVHHRVRAEAGEPGVAIVVIEPLAKVALDQLTTPGPMVAFFNGVRYVAELLSIAIQPRDKQAVDAARRRLWGTALAGSRSATFDTFDNLYKAVNEALTRLYKEFDSDNSELIIRLLQGVVGFFDRCNQQLVFRTMFILQDGFLPWLQDPNRLLGSQLSAIVAVTNTLWDKVCRLLSTTERPDQQLETLTRILCATLGSSHRYIVNSAVSLWNRLYGKAEKLEYPEELKQVLAKLGPYADLVTPGLEFSSLEYPSHEPVFVESMEEFSLPRLPPPSSSRRTTRSASRTNSPVKTPDPVKRRSPTKRRASATPEVKSSGFNLRPKAAAPRLRHDDSQIRFAAVDSSPQLNLIHQDLESQLLTERQREVRERQKENAALFPELRSSPATRTRSSARLAARSREGSPSGAHTPQAGTPSNPGGRFTHHVSGTPTPRRGQALTAIVDQDMDMMDPPSSPPMMEPRRNPLAAEIRSRSANTSLLDDWQLSSSPISGSPLRQQQFAPVPSSLAVAAALDAVDAAAVGSSPPAPAEAEADGQDLMEEDDDIIEESVLPDQENQLLPTREPAKSAKGSALQGGHLGVPRQETPERSDHELEEFVDAPSSPLPPTPHRAGRSATARSTTTQASNTDPVKKAAPAAPAPSPALTPAFATVAPTIAPATTAAAAAPAPTPSGAPSYDGGESDDRSLLKLVVELDSGKLINRQEYTRPSPSVSPEKLPLTAANLEPSSNHSNRPGGSGSGLASAVPSPSPAASCIVALDDNDNIVEESDVAKPALASVATRGRGRVTRSKASSVASNREVEASGEQISSSQVQGKGKAKLKGPTSARAGAGAGAGAGTGKGKGKRKRVASLAEDSAAAAAAGTAAATGTAAAGTAAATGTAAAVAGTAGTAGTGTTPGKKRKVGRSSSTAPVSVAVEQEKNQVQVPKPEAIFYERLPLAVASSRSSSLSQPPSSRASSVSVVSNSVLTERARGVAPGGSGGGGRSSGAQRIVPSSLPQQISQLSAPAPVPGSMEVEMVEARVGDAAEASEQTGDSQGAQAQRVQEIEELSSDGEELVQSQIEFESRSADERQSLSMSQLEEEDLIPSSPFMTVPASGRSGSGGSEDLVEDTVLSQQQEEEERDEEERMDIDVDEQPSWSAQQQQQQQQTKKPEVGNNMNTNTGAEDVKQVEGRLTEDVITSEPGNKPQDSHPGSLQQKPQLGTWRQQQQNQSNQQNQPQPQAGEAKDKGQATSLESNKPNKQQMQKQSTSEEISTSKERIMNMLRGGLNELRAATATGGLSRQEVYEIEDLFMDLKRELYEAERRGRRS
ncbi:Rap1-interacting factor 1 N terminal-domain-containing protein [Pseudoneurospora amorphoporcata]|uniref:Rap1-interacting factor 1 N terminal-domain-containing protein n=1 Tax=Pseudoneurospora amorphoporcata TaxID=241081 RepID=A0AAN6NPG1_9PEZI|nr:Rap1-interacting factor 1 N terminal-domain-containing protein [Pseudoneurospora amorphoporcata]